MFHQLPENYKSKKDFLPYETFNFYLKSIGVWPISVLIVNIPQYGYRGGGGGGRELGGGPGTGASYHQEHRQDLGKNYYSVFQKEKEAQNVRS